MEAILSGAAGLGLLLEGDQAWVIRHNQPDHPVATPPDLGRRLFFGREGTLRHFMITSVAEAYKKLQLLRHMATAFNMTFFLLDDGVPSSHRQETAIDLERLFHNQEVHDYVAGVLYAHPLPPLHGCKSALELARSTNSQQVSSLLFEVLADQEAINIAHQTWPADILAPSERALALQTAVESGLFRHFVQAQHSGHTDSLHFASLKSLQPFANHRELISRWCLTLPHVPAFRPVLTKEKELKQEETHDKNRKKGGVDRRKAFDNAVAIKDQIITLFNQHPLNERKVERLLNGLRHLHTNKSNNTYLSRSLTDLAVRARETDLAEYHLRLSQEAVAANETDGLAWAVFATALRLQGNLKEALKASNRAIDFGNAQFGLCEKAATLKEMNLLEEALTVYHSVIQDFPDNDVARNGRADTLKAMNRQQEALVEYDSVIQDFPNNVVARNGRADTLKAMNRLEEALTTYREIRGRFPYDLIARNGQAGVLLALELIDEAMEVLDLPEIPLSKNDWIGYHIRAGIHLYQGELAEAERLFRWGLENTFADQQDYFRNGLTATYLRKKAFDQAEEELSGMNSPQLTPSVLLQRAHMNGLQGNLARMGELLEQIQASGKIYCHGYFLALSQRFRDHLPMNDDILFQQGACCLALAA
ncbi:MAG: hypothetical protein HQL93_14210 [Magnetococcales bacterium]|nr:hypothetical protein [Magnetococcales bacterium]